MATKQETTSSACLPLIDLSATKESPSKDLLQAAVEWGFLYIRCKALPFGYEDIDSLFDISRNVFELPQSEKEKYKITPEDRGWSGPYIETLDNDTADDPPSFMAHTSNLEIRAFNIGEYKDHEPRQALPRELSTHDEFLDQMQQKCRQLCLQLLEHFAIALRIPEENYGHEFFSSRHAKANGSTGSILRLLYYSTQPSSTPKSGSNSEPIRCGAHTDYGSMTLLFQRPGQPGLEIVSPSGDWMSVDVSPPGTENDAMPPVVVNIGDMLQFWTGGLLRSTRHRVVMPGSRDDRYSIAYFCHPAADTRLIPVPSDLIRQHAYNAGQADSGEKEVITAGEHLRRKLDKAYRWDTDV